MGVQDENENKRLYKPYKYVQYKSQRIGIGTLPICMYMAPITHLLVWVLSSLPCSASLKS